MKQVKFKKWIITAIVSFILAIIFAIMSVASGGASLLNSMYNTGNAIENMAAEFANDNSHQIDGDWNFKIGSDERGTCQYSIDKNGIRTSCSKN